MAILKSSSELFITLYFRLGSGGDELAPVALHFLKSGVVFFFYDMQRTNVKRSTLTGTGTDGEKEKNLLDHAPQQTCSYVDVESKFTSPHHITSPHPRSYVIGTVST